MHHKYHLAQHQTDLLFVLYPPVSNGQKHGHQRSSLLSYLYLWNNVNLSTIIYHVCISHNAFCLGPISGTFNFVPYYILQLSRPYAFTPHIGPQIKVHYRICSNNLSRWTYIWCNLGKHATWWKLNILSFNIILKILISSFWNYGS